VLASLWSLKADASRWRDRRRAVRSRRPFATSLFWSLVALVALDVVAVAGERQALWHVIRACVADDQTAGVSFPCLAVDLSGGIDRGYVVLRSPFGAPDTILAPTRKVVGVEDPWLQSPAAPNYFASALRARSVVNKPDGSAPGLSEVALAVNSRFTRSQDQLHIHIGCSSPRVRRAIRLLAASMKVGEWARVESLVPGSELWGLRTGRSDLSQTEPFRLAAERFAVKDSDLGRLMVSVVGTRIADRDELVLLVADHRGQDRSGHLWAEEIVDPACLAPEESSGRN
jgi:CDP-diacylglycerol pyrophosphatase